MRFWLDRGCDGFRVSTASNQTVIQVSANMDKIVRIDGRHQFNI